MELILKKIFLRICNKAVFFRQRQIEVYLHLIRVFFDDLVAFLFF